MNARTLIIAALCGGIVLGTVGGMASDPVMVPSPEPQWRQLARAQSGTSAAYIAVEAPPQDLTPYPGGWQSSGGQIARYDMPAYQPLNLAAYRVAEQAPLPEMQSDEDQSQSADVTVTYGSSDDAAAAGIAAQDAASAVTEEGRTSHAEPAATETL